MNVYQMKNPLLMGSTTVTNVGRDEHGAFVLTTDNLFHPQGGGQRADHGTLNGMNVVHVVRAPDGIRHYLDDASMFVEGQTVEAIVDGDYRETQKILHFAGHLLADTVMSLDPALNATRGHHYAGEARVEFDGVPSKDIALLKTEIERALADAINARLPVSIGTSADGGRTVAIGNYSPIGCGGTHGSDTGEISLITIRKIKATNGITRVSYDAVPASRS